MRTKTITVVAALTALVMLSATAACSRDDAPAPGGVDQSDPASFATGVVEAARNGRDVTSYAISDRKTGQTCAPDACNDLKSLATVSGTCTRLKGELTAHVESANRDDRTSLIVYITTPDDGSGFCSMHVSKANGKWWLSD